MEKIIIIICLISLYININGQITLKGKVQNKDNEALTGANIYLKNTFEGCTADENGNFEFTTNLKDSLTLVVSFLGYKTSGASMVTGFF